MKKINTRLIATIKNATDGRFNLSGDYLIMLQNITYYLIVNYLATKTTVVDNVDIMVIFDNLYINNDIVDNDNLKEYIHILTGREVNRIKSGKMLLLNCYTTTGELKRCRLFLDPNYNIGF